MGREGGERNVSMGSGVYHQDVVDDSEPELTPDIVDPELWHHLGRTQPHPSNTVGVCVCERTCECV